MNDGREKKNYERSKGNQQEDACSLHVPIFNWRCSWAWHNDCQKKKTNEKKTLLLCAFFYQKFQKEGKKMIDKITVSAILILCRQNVIDNCRVKYSNPIDRQINSHENYFFFFLKSYAKCHLWDKKSHKCKLVDIKNAWEHRNYPNICFKL